MTKIAALVSGNNGKYEFFNWQRYFIIKRLARKNCYNQVVRQWVKKQAGITKDQQKIFKDQINVANNNKEDDVKIGEVEVVVKIDDGETIYNLHHKYIGDKYKNLSMN